jgi:hypothetical protein
MEANPILDLTRLHSFGVVSRTRGFINPQNHFQNYIEGFIKHKKNLKTKTKGFFSKSRIG